MKTGALTIFFALFLSFQGFASGDSEGKFNPGELIMHHIADANEFHIGGNVSVPLPVMIYNRTKGKFHVGLSSQFEHGTKEINGFKMSHSRVVPVDANDKYIDFSITKNVFTMLMAAFLMFFIFTSVARAYKTREGQAPKGLQSFMEPLILFVRDEIAVPNLGNKADKFMPFLLGVFFFIWILNMIGLVPFFPGSGNVTGNIAVTLVLSFITMIVINFNGTKHYWSHLVNPLGDSMPLVAKIPLYLILVPIELAGIVIKPIALMIRLFANITAGHIIILSLTCLIFVFGKGGESLMGSVAGAGLAVPFVLFMFCIELLVAFLQAFIFTMLSALFIGLAVEEGHH